MKLPFFLLVFLIANMGALPALNAAPARFWLSTSDVDPFGPQVPNISAGEGKARVLHIWAQPPTTGAGAFHAATNPFRRLQGFSLNLVTDQPLAEFLDGTFTVHNPVVDGKPRFQFISDSHTAPDGLTSVATAAQVATGTADAIRGDQNKGLQGFSILTDNFTGIGPKSTNAFDQQCYSQDPYCAVTADNSPAWLVATVAFKSVHPSGMSEAFLQIGGNGIIQVVGSSVTQADVIFGVNANGSPPIYNAGNLAHRSVTLPGDEPDVQIAAIPFVGGDFDDDGLVSPQDYVRWAATFGQSVIAGSGGDGNGNGIIDAADYVIWRDHLSSGAGASSISAPARMRDADLAVPEPASCVSTIILAIVAWHASARLGRNPCRVRLMRCA